MFLFFPNELLFPWNTAQTALGSFAFSAQFFTLLWGWARCHFEKWLKERLNGICAQLLETSTRSISICVWWEWTHDHHYLTITAAAMKHHDQSNLGMQRFIWPLLQCYSSPKEHRIGTLTGQGHGDKSWCKGYTGLLLTGLLLTHAQPFS